jgi:DNA-binding XRE family transcriptional regulator
MAKPGIETIQPELPIAAGNRPSVSRAMPREVPARAGRWTLDIRQVERARIIANMTYQQLAAAAHVDRATLSDMLNNRRNPTLGSVHAVIHALGLDPAAVLVFT